MLWLMLIATGALLIFSLTMLMNVLIFPRLKRAQVESAAPSVSVLIPARNEAAVIGQTVKRLLAQDYPALEILILDDGSSDDTAAIAQDAAAGDARLRVLTGRDLPAGWMGKSWACQQLAQAASGDVLIFTDADVRWEHGAVAAVIDQMQSSGVDMLTVWPTQITETMPERLTVPLMALVILGYLPLVMVHHSPFAVFAAANGQCMAWRRTAYNAVGGHSVVANNVLDDVMLARAAKSAGFRIRMTDGNDLIRTRMYDDWASVRAGFAKNILAGYGNSVPALIAGALLHWLVFWLPLVALLLPEYRLWGALLLINGLTLRALSAAFTQQRVLDTLLMPVSVALMTRIALQSIVWHYNGGPRWKGRIVHKEKDDTSWKRTHPQSSSAAASGD